MLFLLIFYPKGYEEEEDDTHSFSQKLIVEVPMVVKIPMVVQVTAPLLRLLIAPLRQEWWYMSPCHHWDCILLHYDSTPHDPPLKLFTGPLRQECCATVLDNINVDQTFTPTRLMRTLNSRG